MTAVTAGHSGPPLQQGVVATGEVPDRRPNIVELADYRCGIGIRRVLRVEQVLRVLRQIGHPSAPRGVIRQFLRVVQREQIAAGPAGPLIRRKPGHLGLSQKQGVADQADQQRRVELFLVADVGQVLPEVVEIAAEQFADVAAPGDARLHIAERLIPALRERLVVERGGGHRLPRGNRVPRVPAVDGRVEQRDDLERNEGS